MVLDTIIIIMVFNTERPEKWASQEEEYVKEALSDKYDRIAAYYGLSVYLAFVVDVDPRNAK